MTDKASIVLGYIGVHQIFQLALAAQEAGQLEALHCSLVNLPGKWGRWLGKRVSASSLNPLGSDQLPPDKLHETPLPILSRQLRRFAPQAAQRDYHCSNSWFDRTLAKRIKHSDASLFIGVETCALSSLKAARARGMKRLLDCPGIPADALQDQVKLATEELSIPSTATSLFLRSAELRAKEMEEADMITVCSEMQYRHYVNTGVPSAKMRVNPLWVDSAFSQMPTRQINADRNVPLRVLFVGTATVAKGAPYAIQAMQLAGDKATLTFCGGVDETVRLWAGNKLDAHTVLGWRPRSALPEVYAAHDVLVFPTLGDSFGFVALEAMACGLPVIATTQAGAPLPDESWRVPPRDAEALAQSILRYTNDRDLLQRDSHAAQEFSRGFTPASFRERARAIFSELLSAP